MDLALGGDLKFQLATNKTFAEFHVKFVIASMILALQYLHDKESKFPFSTKILSLGFEFFFACLFFFFFFFFPPRKLFFTVIFNQLSSHSHMRIFYFIYIFMFLKTCRFCFFVLFSTTVLHRDIKPANMLMKSDGYVMLTDFGLSIKISHLNPSEVSGTDGYIPPEMYQSRISPKHTSDKGLLLASDWFAVSVMMFSLLCDSSHTFAYTHSFIHFISPVHDFFDFFFCCMCV
jgi:serine/threonine protein kinase